MPDLRSRILQQGRRRGRSRRLLSAPGLAADRFYTSFSQRNGRRASKYPQQVKAERASLRLPLGRPLSAGARGCPLLPVGGEKAVDLAHQVGQPGRAAAPASIRFEGGVRYGCGAVEKGFFPLALSRLSRAACLPCLHAPAGRRDAAAPGGKESFSARMLRAVCMAHAVLAGRLSACSRLSKCS